MASALIYSFLLVSVYEAAFQGSIRVSKTPLSNHDAESAPNLKHTPWPRCVDLSLLTKLQIPILMMINNY
jgi:hypothetical protein